MSTKLSLRSPSSLQAAIDGVKCLFRNAFHAASAPAAANTGDVWRLYRLAGGADSVSPAALDALSRHAAAR